MLSFIQQHIAELFIVLLSIIVFFQLLYYFLLFARFAFHKPKKKSEVYAQAPVSVVITARNEAHNLIKSLPVLLNQHYNNYEVVVVNDNSVDETAQVVTDFKTRYPHLKFVDLNSSVTTIKGKKFPLSLGIKAASNEILLLTDADCTPASPYWLQNMANHFVNKTEIVLGYCKYEKKSGFFNLMVRYDSVHTAMQYFSYALARTTYMGNGRNLAYTKSLFLKQRGFASHNHIKYGDDDIFIERAAKKNNCEIEYFKESVTISRPPLDFKRWFQQKKGHLISRSFFTVKHRFLLNAYEWLVTLFFLVFIFALYFSLDERNLIIATIAIFFVKFAAQYSVFGFSAAKLQEKSSLVPYTILLDLLFAVLYPLIFISSKITSKKAA